jgi:hypothetical protein
MHRTPRIGTLLVSLYSVAPPVGVTHIHGRCRPADLAASVNPSPSIPRSPVPDDIKCLPEHLLSKHAKLAMHFIDRAESEVKLVRCITYPAMFKKWGFLIK